MSRIFYRVALRRIAESYGGIDFDIAYTIERGLSQLKDADGENFVGEKIGLTLKSSTGSCFAG